MVNVHVLVLHHSVYAVVKYAIVYPFRSLLLLLPPLSSSWSSG
jgi:hypothetical protein